MRETDLMGRNGILTVDGKKVETPCLTPVVHPVTVDIPISQFKQMGFDALMTNSLIAYRRRREEALEKGLHAMLGFDGVIMTDSGGYQVLEYGQQDITPSIIAEFQSSIGSDLAVTLDRPTGYSHSREYAEETVDVSLKGARETMKKFGRSKTTWVGPIQGGLFGDLVARSAKALVRSGFEILALGSPVELMENYLFEDLVRMIVAAKKSIPYSTPFHLFGAGHPLTLPLSVALGCDTFDSASYILFAKQGRYMTERGTLVLEDMTHLPCSCPTCNSTTRTDLVLMKREERVRKLALHNLYLLRQDVLRCREAISEGRLWDLVEERAIVHPRTMAAFAELAKNSKWLGSATPHFKDRGLIIRSELDATRPEVGLVAERLEGAMNSNPGRKSRSGNKGDSTAYLLVSDDEKPLSRNPMSAKVRTRIEKEPHRMYKLHPVLGAYPAELEFVYPFTQTVTEMEVTKKGIREAVKVLRRLGYNKVLVCDRKGVKTVTSRSR
ncbi:MAG: tRNA guanosine(15) transglycosylase TgtA [Thaumarchaeota archaeon]|nr:tRNA guanosine(15) transglycosylase TgtA [Nitrososphaerota archaeon]